MRYLRSSLLLKRWVGQTDAQDFERRLQSCVGQGFEIGLDLKMPYVGIKAEAVISKCEIWDFSRATID